MNRDKNILDLQIDTLKKRGNKVKYFMSKSSSPFKSKKSGSLSPYKSKKSGSLSPYKSKKSSQPRSPKKNNWETFIENIGITS